MIPSILGHIIVIAALALLVFVCVREIVKETKSGSCGGCCSSCGGHCGHCSHSEAVRK